MNQNQNQNQSQPLRSDTSEQDKAKVAPPALQTPASAPPAQQTPAKADPVIAPEKKS